MNSGTVLDRIAASVSQRLEERKSIVSENQLRILCERARQPHSFEEVFALPGINIVAEIKFSSPSQGDITSQKILTPEFVAGDYLKNGAAALSILTEQDHFQGSLDYLRRVRQAFPEARLLMKDFVIDEYQLLEARTMGADAALLIVALLGQKRTRELLSACRRLGLTALVEVHDSEELKIALDLGATLIGVNNRNLKTLEISLDTSYELISQLNTGALGQVRLISESGLSHGSQLNELRQAGYSGFLIGTTFMKSGMKTGSPGQALAQIRMEAR